MWIKYYGSWFALNKNLILRDKRFSDIGRFTANALFSGKVFIVRIAVTFLGKIFKYDVDTSIYSFLSVNYRQNILLKSICSIKKKLIRRVDFWKGKDGRVCMHTWSQYSLKCLAD